MPYANICRRPGTVLKPGSDEWKPETDPIPGVRLQWSDAEVQISVQPMSWGREQPNVDGGDLSGPWANLSRYEINQLIKQLRTARDRAFGRDE